MEIKIKIKNKPTGKAEYGDLIEFDNGITALVICGDILLLKSPCGSDLFELPNKSSVIGDWFKQNKYKILKKRKDLVIGD